MKRMGRKRLSIDIPEKIHTEIKKLAAIHNCTMTRWILRAIINQLKFQVNHGTTNLGDNNDSSSI